MNHKIFVPTAIYNSPFNPDSEMIIILRGSDDVEILGLDCKVVKDENTIAKKFLISQF
jgi:hypothetical protein